MSKGGNNKNWGYASIIKYNDENSLSCVVSLAYYAAQDYYEIQREIPFGYGYADLIFRPKGSITKPAMLIELKWDKLKTSAMDQIKEKHYPEIFDSYKGEIILVSLNYNKKTKKHECQIEKINK